MYTATTEISPYCHTLSLHDALPISSATGWRGNDLAQPGSGNALCVVVVPADGSFPLTQLRLSSLRSLRRSWVRGCRSHTVVATGALAKRKRPADRKSTRLNSSH